MSTTEQLSHRRSGFDVTVPRAVTVIGIVTAIAVAAVLLVLLAGSSKPAAHPVPASADNAPLIHYRGTGAPPTTTPAPVAQTSVDRAEHGYGLIP
jgi:hypothetical protein